MIPEIAFFLGIRFLCFSIDINYYFDLIFIIVLSSKRTSSIRTIMEQDLLFSFLRFQFFSVPVIIMFLAVIVTNYVTIFHQMNTTCRSDTLFSLFMCFHWVSWWCFVLSVSAQSSQCLHPNESDCKSIACVFRFSDTGLIIVRFNLRVHSLSLPRKKLESIIRKLLFASIATQGHFRIVLKSLRWNSTRFHDRWFLWWLSEK